VAALKKAASIVTVADSITIINLTIP
jgi:hypothetical protein